MMDDVIASLDDAQAVCAVLAFAVGRLNAGAAAEKHWTPEIERALRRALPVGTGAGSVSVSEGDLARQALSLLADDPRNHEALPWLIGLPPETFAAIGGSSVALAAATLVVLQSNLVFERDEDGTLRARIEKEPTRAGLLESLVEALLRFRS